MSPSSNICSVTSLRSYWGCDGCLEAQDPLGNVPIFRHLFCGFSWQFLRLLWMFRGSGSPMKCPHLQTFVLSLLLAVIVASSHSYWGCDGCLEAQDPLGTPSSNICAVASPRSYWGCDGCLEAQEPLGNVPFFKHLCCGFSSQLLRLWWLFRGSGSPRKCPHL